MKEKPSPCREKKNPYKIWCSVCDTIIARALMFGSASVAKRNHFRSTGHPLDGMTATQTDKKPPQKIEQFKMG